MSDDMIGYETSDLNLERLAYTRVDRLQCQTGAKWEDVSAERLEFVGVDSMSQNAIDNMKKFLTL